MLSPTRFRINKVSPFGPFDEDGEPAGHEWVTVQVFEAVGPVVAVAVMLRSCDPSRLQSGETFEVEPADQPSLGASVLAEMDCRGGLMCKTDVYIKQYLAARLVFDDHLPAQLRQAEEVRP